MTRQLSPEQTIHHLMEIESLLSAGTDLPLAAVVRAIYQAFESESVGLFLQDAPPYIEGDERLLTDEAHGLISFPVQSDAGMYGTLRLAAAHPLTDTQRLMLQLIAQKLGNAIKNAERFSLMQRQSLELQWLNRFGDSLLNLLSTLQIDEVASRIMSAVKDMLDVEETSIMLKDRETSDLILWQHTPPERDLAIRLKPGQGIAGWVLETGQAALVNDVHKDWRWESTIDKSADFTTRSLLAQPIHLDNQIIGVVEAVNKINGDFTDDDVAVLATLSKWAAIAIGNANTVDELKRTHEHLSDAKKQAAMAQMVLNLAHKINNSVGAIRVWAMELYQELSDDEQDIAELKALIGNILANVGETLLMVKRTRSATEIQKDEMHPVNVVDALEAAVRVSRLDSQIRIERRYDEDLPTVGADAERLVEVFLNLVNNAGDVMGSTGTLTLELRRIPGGDIEAIIQDNGSGVPEHLRGVIFDPFVTSKVDGLGLGLWMVKLYVELIGGSIDMATEVGKGTTFRVTLPAWEKC